MRENLEYGLVRAVAGCLGRMPRGLARGLAGGLAFAVYWCFGRLRRVGMRNLELALPELSLQARKKILRRVYIHLGWQLVEFCRMTRYTAENTRELDAHRGSGALPRGAGPRQGRPHHHRAPGRMGAFQLLPLAHGPSHGHDHPQSRQPPPRCSTSTASAACTATS